MFIIGTYWNTKYNDQSVEINHNPNWPNIPNHPYRIETVGRSGAGKKHQRPNIDKIYLFVKDPFESKHQLLINGREGVVIKNLKIPNAFIDYSQTIDDDNIFEDYNTRKKKKVLIVFDDMIADTESNNKLSPKVTELFLKSLKCHSLVLIWQSWKCLNL